jgi:hypothetical protein
MKPPPRLKNASREDINGWIHVRIAGTPRERGFQHGFLLAPEIRDALRSIEYLVRMDTGIEFTWFCRNAQAIFEKTLASNFGGQLADGSGVEVLEEIEGIVEGANANRGPRERKLTLAEMLGWNGYPELICQWFPAVMSGQIQPAVPLPKAPPAGLHAVHHRWHHFGHHCSAFVAAGKLTKDGEVVIAQTTWQRFANGDAYNVILDIAPRRGARLLMQSVPGYVASSTDFWVTDAGLAVAETSINGSGFDPAGLPEFFRARRAAQYAETIDEWIALFRCGNNGGYTNTWFLGDVNRRRIAAYELTLHYEAMQPQLRSGFYAGYNIPLDLQVRNLGCAGPSGFDNVLQSGARRVRWEQLRDQHAGMIDASVATRMLADHRDVYLDADCPSPRTICGHTDNDGSGLGGNEPWYPWGSLDGKVTSGQLARDMKLIARWGRACGTPFEIDPFLARHPQYAWLRGHMKDRPTQPWTKFTAR